MTHHTAENKHPKHDFQVERLAFFSDAVFAIAITLLVIEFKIPHLDNNTTHEQIVAELKAMRYQFIALLFSFLLIASYWVRHHMLFKHVHDYNRPVLMCNLFVLLPVIFFPFTTTFFYESVNNMQVLPLAMQLFLYNNIAAALMIYLLYWLVTKKYPHMTYDMEKDDRDMFEKRLLVMTASFACMLIISYINIEYAVYGLVPMVIVRLARTKVFHRKKPATAKHAK